MNLTLDRRFSDCWSNDFGDSSGGWPASPISSAMLGYKNIPVSQLGVRPLVGSLFLLLFFKKSYPKKLLLASKMGNNWIVNYYHGSQFYGRIERWVGLDRQAHRYLCYSMSFLIVMMIILIGIGFGFAIFPLLFSLFLCLIGCVGWRCVLPDTSNENGGS